MPPSTRPGQTASPSTEPVPFWYAEGRPFFAYSSYLRKRYGGRVWRISLDGGFTCPNVDGRVARGGCTFCRILSFSPSRRVGRQAIAAQIDRGITALRRRYGNVERFIAYFQPATNTYGPVAYLREIFWEALRHPAIVAIAIGTRPDCVDEPVLDLLAELASQIDLSVEYGMQTMHDRSLRAMNRGHDHAATIRAVEASRGRGFRIGLHLLVGWPGESHQDVLASAREIARLNVDAVKIHSLYAVHGTPLGEQVLRGEVRLLDEATYVTWVADILERLPPSVVVERLLAQAPPRYLIGPKWCLRGAEVRRRIEGLLAERQSYQGRLYRAG